MLYKMKNPLLIKIQINDIWMKHDKKIQTKRCFRSIDTFPYLKLFKLSSEEWKFQAFLKIIWTSIQKIM